MKKLNINKINAKIENEGFDYWVTNYAQVPLEDTKLEKYYLEYMQVRAILIKELEKEGIKTLEW